MTLHLERRVELLITVLALCQITEVQILLFLVVNVTLYVRHYAHIVIEHLVAVPALKNKQELITTCTQTSMHFMFHIFIIGQKKALHVHVFRSKHRQQHNMH